MKVINYRATFKILLPTLILLLVGLVNTAFRFPNFGYNQYLVTSYWLTLLFTIGLPIFQILLLLYYEATIERQKNQTENYQNTTITLLSNCNISELDFFQKASFDSSLKFDYKHDSNSICQSIAKLVFGVKEFSCDVKIAKMDKSGNIEEIIGSHQDSHGKGLPRMETIAELNKGKIQNGKVIKSTYYHAWEDQKVIQIPSIKKHINVKNKRHKVLFCAISTTKGSQLTIPVKVNSSDKITTFVPFIISIYTDKDNYFTSKRSDDVLLLLTELQVMLVRRYFLNKYIDAITH